MTVISLSTDFGSGDHEAGVLKGVIWRIAPQVKIVDLSHDITPHDILEGTTLLWHAAPYFPSGSIHVVVVDPGVGTSRRGIAARLGSQYFVGPDNGLITLLLDHVIEKNDSVEFVHLDKPGFWLPEVAPVFHGRDVFTPVAAHLSLGIPLNALGSPITDPVRLQVPEPMQTSQGWDGQVIHMDHFGNLSTNLNRNHIARSKEVVIRFKGKEIAGLVTTFGERPPGSLVALFDSSGSLTISVVNGNAAERLNAGVGDNIEVLVNG